MSEEKNERPSQNRTRELLGLLKHSIQFINQEIELLLIAIGRYSVPLLLLAMFSAYTQDLPARFENLLSLKKAESKSAVIILVLSSLAYVASFCTLTLVVNLVFTKKKSEDETSVRRLSKEFKTDFSVALKKYIPNFLIIYLAYKLISGGLTYMETTLTFSEYEDYGIPGLDIFFQWLVKNGASLILTPAVLFFGFTSLYVSVKEDVGSSDALKKIFQRSRDKFANIWIFSLVYILIALAGQGILDFQSNLLIKNLPFSYPLLFVIMIIEKLLSLFLLIVLQVGSILIYKREENQESKEPIEAESFGFKN